ncbi:hypothetical protein BKA69DRAFT_1051651 [Paraphysoderma sedebokerense]|nr:hypothetical protein BKA69DRAFT_1051651 [Paraphysoderma sedebokerense]
MHMTIELHDFKNWQFFVNAYIPTFLCSHFSDFVNLYHYVERLLIVTNRTHLRKYIFIALLFQLPWFIIDAITLNTALQGMMEFIVGMQMNWAAFSAGSLVNNCLKLFTAATDSYVLYILHKKGLGKTGLSKTRIFRIVLSALFSIVCFAVWFPKSSDESAVFTAMIQLQLALDCIVIIDFFNIDIQNNLQGTGNRNQKNVNPSGSTNTGKTTSA